MLKFKGVIILLNILTQTGTLMCPGLDTVAVE